MEVQSRNPVFMQRPWGWMISVIHIRRMWIKVIRVHSGQRTSDQMHHERREYHINIFKPWRSVFIPVGVRHRMVQGLYVELALGKPREADIVRFSDDYGRV